MTFVALWPVHLLPSLACQKCIKLSLAFGLWGRRSSLLGDFIDFYVVPGVKEEFVAEKKTTWPVCFLALRETAEQSVA